MFEILQIIYGVVFILFLPGFIVSYLFFESKKIDVIERLALSFALSIAIVPLTVFYANLLGVKINQFSVSLVVLNIISLSLLILLVKFVKSRKK